MNSLIIRVKAFVRSRLRSRHELGQTLALMVIALPAFIGALGLAIDVGNFYFQYYRSQTAVDAAALAGATCQAESSKCTPGGSSTATTYATTNDSTMTLLPNPVAAPVFSSTYCPSSTYTTPCMVTVSATQTVPYYFARLVGVNSGTFNVTSTAVGGPANSYTPPGGGSNMIPMGLDYTVPYQDLRSVTLAYKTAIGSGNWAFLAIGGSGDSQLKTNIQSGVQTNMSIWNGTSTSSSSPSQFVTTEPGVGNGFTYMNTYHYSSCAGQVPSNDPSSQCLVCVPLVNFSYDPTCTGKTCTLPIMGFAEFFVTGVSGAPTDSVTATWVQGLCQGSGFNNGAGTPPQYGALAIQLIN